PGRAHYPLSPIRRRPHQQRLGGPASGSGPDTTTGGCARADGAGDGAGVGALAATGAASRTVEGRRGASLSAGEGAGAGASPAGAARSSSDGAEGSKRGCS